MKSPYVNELQPNHNVEAVFMVSHKEVRQKKTGEPYLHLVLVDKTGDIEAKMWDNAAEAIPTFSHNDFVRVKGATQVFQNRLQFTVHRLKTVPESELDLGDFLPASKRDRDEMLRELRAHIEGIQNPHLRALLEGLFADPAVAHAYKDAPAAKTVHHAWIGGLIEHVLSLCGLAKFAAAHYSNIDGDLLMAGVILHDIGKTRELEFARAIRYSDAGQLLGHIQIGMQMVTDEARKVEGFPPRLLDLLLHMILSHHGQLDFGSAKVPVFPEALLLHLLDNMDSKMETMRGMVEHDRFIDGNWTLYNSALERTALKKDRYLNVEEKREAGHEVAASPLPTPMPVPIPARESKPADASPFAEKLKGALKA